MHNHPANGRGIKNAAIRLSVRLSVCLFHAHSTKMVHFMAMVRPIIEHQEDTSCWKSNPLVSIATESSQNGNEAVAGAASEAFARWLHHRYALVKLPSGSIPFRLPIRCNTVCANFSNAPS